MTPEPSDEYQKLVETVARAIARTISKRHGHNDDGEGWLNNERREESRAALSALKLPHAGDDGLPMSEQNVQVTQDDALTFANEALRNIEITALNAEDLDDIAGALTSFLQRHRTRAEPDLVEAAKAVIAVATFGGADVAPCYSAFREPIARLRAALTRAKESASD